MKLGFFKLISSQVDVMHYIQKGDEFYTLSYLDSVKVTEINNGSDIYIDFIEDLKALKDERPEDPYHMAEGTIDEATKVVYTKDASLAKEVVVITDEQEVKAFYDLSDENSHNHFKSFDEKPLALIKFSL